MLIFRQFTLLVFWLLILGMNVTAAEVACVDTFDPEIDYYPDKVELRHAHNFSVAYHQHYKVVTIYSQALEPTETRDVLLLVRCGSPVPELVGDLASATVITTPVTTVTANEDLSLYRTWLLGRSDSIVAMGGAGIFTAELRAKWDNREVRLIGESFHGPPNYEHLLELNPGVVFLTTASLARAGTIQRARELGLPAVPSISWAEITPLGQAEWLHYVALFLDAEAASIAEFDRIEQRYLRLTALAQTQADRPLLMWFDPGGQRDRWQVPENNWATRLIEDAGGQTPWADPDGEMRRFVTTEDILLRGNDIEYVVTTSVGLKAPGTAGVLERLVAIRDGRFYDVHQRSVPENDAYDWYESAAVEVDKVLADFVALLHPSLLSEHKFHHLQPARRGLVDEAFVP